MARFKLRYQQLNIVGNIVNIETICRYTNVIMVSGHHTQTPVKILNIDTLKSITASSIIPASPAPHVHILSYQQLQ